jgi:hypothetical protein
VVECRITDAINDARLRSLPAHRQRGVDLISEVLLFGQLCYGWIECGQQRCQLRDALQPLT